MGRKSKKQIEQERQKDQLIVSIVSLLVILLLVVASGQYGLVGEFLFLLFSYIFGIRAWYFIIFLIFCSLFYLFGLQRFQATRKTVIAAVLFILAALLYIAIDIHGKIETLTILQDFFKNTTEMFSGEVSFGAGLIGTMLFSFSCLLLDVTGTYLLIIALILCALLLILDFSVYQNIGSWFKSLFNKEKKVKRKRRKEESFYNEELLVNEVKNKTKSKKVKEFIDIDDRSYKKEKRVMKSFTPSLKQSDDNYILPSLDLLDEPVLERSGENRQVAREKASLLIRALAQFNIKAELVAIHIGPSVTKFEIRPEVGLKIGKISALADDIKMALAATDIRIEAPIPGYNTVGVEIPNYKMTNVSLSEIMGQLPKAATELTLALGKNLQGEAIFLDLDRMPHLLVAGATGSGKSVCINSFILSLLLQSHPDKVKLLLIDPKKVEFMPFSKLPHLIAPVITDAKHAATALKRLVVIMDNRYEIFKECKVRNIAAYNTLWENDKNKTMKRLPYIIVIIDELADLMLVTGKDVEGSIQRITQLARAAGIYVIVATQRPSVDIITGPIKANIPSRIAFAVSSGVDSRTIIDGVGAERLLGHGDMLYYPSGHSGPMRVQGTYVSDLEIKRISEFVANQKEPEFDEYFLNLEISEENSDDMEGSIDDPLYEEVKRFVLDTRKASTSSIQRRFRLGYNRAARIIDMLEAHGVVGPSQGSKPRQVYHLGDGND